MGRPTFSVTAPRYRGRTSADINIMFNDIETDLTSSYLDYSTLLRRLKELRIAITREQITMSTRLDSLEAQVQQLLDNTGSNILYRSFDSLRNIVYFPTSVVSATNQATVNTEFRACHLPVTSEFSQVRYQDIVTGENVVNSGVTVSVNPYTDGAFAESNGTVEATDTNNMLDGDPVTFYQRKVKYPIFDPQPAVECEIVITLPQNLDAYSNTIIINPFPEGGVHILGIDYASVTSPTSYNSVNESDFADGPIYSSQRIQYRIPKAEIGALRIRLRQDSWHVENGTKVFTYGIRDIDVRRSIYESPGELGMKFEIPSDVSGYFNQITGFTAQPTEDVSSMVFTAYPNLANFNSKSSGARLAGTYPIDIRTWLTRSIYVGVSISSEILDGGSPLLERMFLTYSTY